MSLDESAVARNQVDWAQAEQAWADWREAISRHFTADVICRLEQAWAAGVLDAAMSSSNAGGTPPDTSSRDALQVRRPFDPRGRADIVRFYRAIGNIGTLTGPEEMGGRAYYVWRATGMEDIEGVWQALGPFLGLGLFSDFRRALVTPELKVFRSASTTRRLPRKLTKEARVTKTRSAKSHGRGKRAPVST